MLTFRKPAFLAFTRCRLCSMSLEWGIFKCRPHGQVTARLCQVVGRSAYQVFPAKLSGASLEVIFSCIRVEIDWYLRFGMDRGQMYHKYAMPSGHFAITV